jgi:putative ABC transport system permease protein
MRLRLFLTLAVRNVFRNRTRSGFALGTIALGAMGLYLFMGFNGGLMNQYRANTIRARYGHGELTRVGYRGQAHAHPQDLWIDDAPAVARTLRACPVVREVFPRVSFGAFLIKDSASLGAVGEGIDGPAEARFFDSLNFLSGHDLGDSAGGIVLGYGLAKGLGARVGETLTISARTMRGDPTSVVVEVLGVFQTGVPAFDDSAFRVPLAMAQTLVGTARVERISVALAQDGAWPNFEAYAARMLPGVEAVPFDVLDEVYYKHGVDWLDAQFGFIRAIILLVVFLGIFNVISMGVVERTGEIGTLRANGEARWEIAAGHLAEGIVTGVLGGVLGLGLAWLVATFALRHGVAMPPAPGITRSFRIFIRLRAWEGAEVLALCIATTAIGSVIPVARAVHLPIPAALQRL